MASHEVEQAPDASFGSVEQNENAFAQPSTETNYGVPAPDFSNSDQYIEPTQEQGYQPQESADSFGEYNVDQAGGGFNETPLSEQYSEGLSEAASESEPAYEMNSSENFDYTDNLNQPVEPIVEPKTSDDSNFADVLEFANANTNSGNFSYAVIVEGIDSSHLVHQLREAMTDSKFGWNVSELLTHIGGGRLVITGLSPAKASVFINRIKYLPFKVSWRQDVLSGS
ncbi:hypothetical protein B9G69_007045 [Bdellovibrio sp. SKB1291214]|uniref:hypothetical protein n=1 Tax=Bdellovibrio sp. SKB1291214 TaxID=1732569 RepID=UPI0020CFC860|nr:hypothetical protein [Bdellovibrio sp. SKB1291214]UYL10335.1 hypothetical protein B9G69_007045 [Bdellovibrio sp. SKB1291214]